MAIVAGSKSCGSTAASSTADRRRSRRVDLERLLRRDRAITGGGLALVIALAWIWLLAGAGMGMSATGMTAMYGIDMDMPLPVWSVAYAATLFLMWLIMMIAMMLPSAAPVLLLAAALNRRAGPARSPYGNTAHFAAGYLLAWAGFSAIAVLAQWGLTAAGLLDAMMQATHGRLAGGLLLAAGLWQLTPLKGSCLRQCRSPVSFLTLHRRPGDWGALRMGLDHGAYCLGCCWLLMALLFVGGVMNLYWIVGLAVYVLGEKLLPGGARLARWAGLMLAIWGMYLLVQ